ncbi:MAG TPA: nucleotidyl transferase AbiEii/AbiGii toxin family protein [Vicinamibacteria bacterium]|nr:nucleotidyl transferase AbiEii/AbiGii toxin family protein [Vicinamibacteria bacterium]
MTVSELRARLDRGDRAERLHLLGRVDPAEEIFANKLCTLLGRSEIRDLVDARALEGLGLSLTEALAAGPARLGAVADHDRR